MKITQEKSQKTILVDTVLNTRRFSERMRIKTIKMVSQDFVIKKKRLEAEDVLVKRYQ